MSNYFIVDAQLKQRNISKNKNTWDTYFEEILNRCGVQGLKAPSQQEIDYANTHMLFIGECRFNFNDTKFKLWLENGGCALVFNTKTARDIMGFKSVVDIKQDDDEFTTSAYVSFTDTLTNSCKNTKFKTLPVYSPVSYAEPCEDTEILAKLHRPTIFGLDKGDDTPYPAICKKNIGKGSVYYFAFSLTQTLFVLHQGRPIDKDYDGDGYYRTADGIVLLRGHDLTIPYSDIYCDIIRHIAAECAQPVLHTMPIDENNNIIDFIIHYGGDDEGSDDYQMQACEIMKQQNLPYHVNLMLNKNKEFAITKQQYDYLKQNNTTPSIHFDFFRARQFYTQDELNLQLDKYVKEFGEIPKISVNHVLMATGWAEHARWCSERGILGDNTKVHKHLMPDYNPINTAGMAFGTSLPSFVYEDAQHENEKLKFISIPIVFFEPRIWPDTKQQDMQRIDEIIEMAYEYDGAMNVFAHPIYLVKEPALITALEYIKQKVKGYNIKHTDNDFLCDWWYDRAEISVTDLKITQNSITFNTNSKRAFALKFQNIKPQYLQSGVSKKAVTKMHFNVPWQFIIVQPGMQSIEIKRS